jgi:outer membrane protein assembly factor BamB
MSYRDAPPSPHLLVTFGRQLHAMDPETGAVVWSNEDVDGGGSIVVVGSRVVVTGQSFCTCIDATNGKTLWSQILEIHGRPAVLIEGDRIYIAGGGEVQCLSMTGGRPLWHEPFKGKGNGDTAIALGTQTAHQDARG